MHAPALRHSNLNHIVGLALILGLAASLALNVVMVTRSDEPAATGVAPQPDTTYLAKQQRYFEAKMARIEAMEATYGAQYVAPPQARTSGPNSGVVDVDQWRADQLVDALQSRADQMERADYRAWQRDQAPTGALQSRADQMERADYRAWQRDQASPAGGASDGNYNH